MAYRAPMQVGPVVARNPLMDRLRREASANALLDARRNLMLAIRELEGVSSKAQHPARKAVVLVDDAMTALTGEGT